MFAGAAREAVFSNPAVIHFVNAEFVPVALKAGLVNGLDGSGDDQEGDLCRAIGRSKPAPQGIRVANSAGRPLDRALSFDDEKSVVAFLEHARRRFNEPADSARGSVVERYMNFPSAKLPDFVDPVWPASVPERHPDTKSCPARPRLRPGTVVARVVGRALDARGEPVADTVSQELWVMDADGTNERRLFEIDANPFPGRASWQPTRPVGPPRPGR